ncbi:MAG: hypothetical protein NTZ27_02295 [Ignavibacteriales bacterium]|nr:hypothetical protein [Ignavibacteriales bacterium]
MIALSKINRKSFFEKIGKGALVAVVASVIPFKFFTSVAKTSSNKNIKIKIHPFAVKRKDKV